MSASPGIVRSPEPPIVGSRLPGASLDRPVAGEAPCRRLEEFIVTRWEYATAPLISHALQQILNQWGSDGWELVCVVDNVAYFKRPTEGGE